MKYRQIVQKSREYKYGKGEEFETKDEAFEKVKKAEQELKSCMALKKVYYISIIEVEETSNGFQIVVTTEVPKLF